MNSMICPTCNGEEFLPTELWTKEAMSGSNGSTAWKMSQVVKKCPDCDFWHTIEPFLRVALVIPDTFPGLNFYGPESKTEPVATLSLSDFRQLRDMLSNWKR